MNKKIQTYDDLQEEKKRLENLLALHKNEINGNWDEVKLSLAPLNNTFSFIGKITKRDKSNPLLNIGIGFAGDLLIKRFLLAKAGFVARLVLPFVVKNYSSHVLNQNNKGILGKIKNIFSKKSQHNGHTDIDLTTSEWKKYS